MSDVRYACNISGMGPGAHSWGCWCNLSGTHYALLLAWQTLEWHAPSYCLIYEYGKYVPNSPILPQFCYIHISWSLFYTYFYTNFVGKMLYFDFIFRLIFYPQHHPQLGLEPQLGGAHMYMWDIHVQWDIQVSYIGGATPSTMVDIQKLAIWGGGGGGGVEGTKLTKLPNFRTFLNWNFICCKIFALFSNGTIFVLFFRTLLK